MSDIQKVVRDGMVAVIYSPGYGAGWSTWNPDYKHLLMYHPKLVELIEEDKSSEITEDLLESLGAPDVYIPSRADFDIAWLPQGSQFFIHEYDGSERIQLVADVAEVA